MAAVQTTDTGHPVPICLSQRQFTRTSIKESAEQSLTAPAMLVSDGLGCFKAIRSGAILHEPRISGGGAASVRNPTFIAVNTELGNIKTSTSGAYHAFEFATYAKSYLG